METIICDWSSIHLHGPIWFEHLKVRKRAFVDGQGWDVHHTNEVEWDQYDTPLTKYVITHDGGRVLTASRVLPCSFSGPNYSNMIRDAALGRLPNIPPGIVATASTETTSFEATRFTADPSLPRRTKVDALRKNAINLIAHCERSGAKRVFALMPPGFVAWLRRADLNAHAVGPITENHKGEIFQVIECCRPFFLGGEMEMRA